MKKKWMILIAVAIFLAGFYAGLLSGRDTTVVRLKGMPDNAVIHFEVDKGAGGMK